LLKVLRKSLGPAQLFSGPLSLKGIDGCAVQVGETSVLADRVSHLSTERMALGVRCLPPLQRTHSGSAA
jgi:hypothetical protein